jgi:hypothetical protein
MNMLSKWTLALALTLLMPVCFAQGAVAQNCTTLVYIGAPQTVWHGLCSDGLCNGPSPNMEILGTVTLSAPLAAGLLNASVTPLAWDFSSQQTGFNSAAVPGVVAVKAGFNFWTDANGNITGWNFALDYSDGTTRISDTSQNPPVVLAPPGSYCGYQPCTYYDDLGYSIAIPGVYSLSLDSASATAGSWHCLAPVVDPLTAQVTALKAQVATLQSFQAYWQWQGVGWKARADTLTVQLANANREIADLLARLKK